MKANTARAALARFAFAVATLPAVTVIAAVTSPAFAHLNPIEHGAGDPPHAFGPMHALATIVVVLVIAVGVVMSWRRRHADGSQVRNRRKP